MPPLGFRWKLFLAMVLVVAGVTGAALGVTQQAVQAASARFVEERFRSEVALFSGLQAIRLGAVKDRCLELARSVRLMAAMGEHDPDLLYRITFDELRDVITPPSGRQTLAPASFFRVLDAAGRILPPPDERAGSTSVAAHGDWERSLERGARGLDPSELQGFGYLSLARPGENPALQEVVITLVRDPVERRSLGMLAIGFPMPEGGGEAMAGELRNGVWLGGRLYSQSIPEEARAEVAGSFDLEGSAQAPHDVKIGGVAHRLLFRRLEQAPGFPHAYQVSLYSLADAEAEARRLRRRVLVLGALALGVAVLLSLGVSQGLAGPIRALSAAAGEIGRGNYDVRVRIQTRDELGRLAGSFNEMAEGLALKERTRRMLDRVADKDVAEELLSGRIALGGEERDATVLFCDLRGFTAFTEKMPPSEVVGFLNEHMTALTRTVYDHHGVVDKFVGDMVMALFGAPRVHGDDAANAVRCAWHMVAARETLNRETGRSLAVGIGIASGSVVAGGMGSADRLNYTVLGERVNLASRLCSIAAPMEILMDEETRRRLPPAVGVEPLRDLELKGFSRSIRAYRLTRIGGADGSS